MRSTATAPAHVSGSHDAIFPALPLHPVPPTLYPCPKGRIDEPCVWSGFGGERVSKAADPCTRNRLGAHPLPLLFRRTVNETSVTPVPRRVRATEIALHHPRKRVRFQKWNALDFLEIPLHPCCDLGAFHPQGVPPCLRPHIGVHFRKLRPCTKSSMFEGTVILASGLASRFHPGASPVSRVVSHARWLSLPMARKAAVCMAVKGCALQGHQEGMEASPVSLTQPPDALSASLNLRDEPLLRGEAYFSQSARC